VPLGFGWLPPEEPPYDELPMRVQRIAYREFSRNPDLPFARYKEILGRAIFGAGSTPQAVEDLLTVQAAFARERTWCQPSPLACLLDSRSDLLRDGVRLLKQVLPTGAELLGLVGDLLDFLQYGSTVSGVHYCPLRRQPPDCQCSKCRAGMGVRRSLRVRRPKLLYRPRCRPGVAAGFLLR
jgi:hypothetical protein